MEQADLETLVRQTNELAKENNRILRAIRRDAWISFFGRMLFWIVIIVVPTYFAVTYLQPYLSAFSGGAQNAGATGTPNPVTGALKNLGLPADTNLNDIVNQYKDAAH